MTSQTASPEGQTSDEPNPSPEAMMQALIDGPAPADGASPEATSDAAPSQPVPIPVPEAPAVPPAETPAPPSAEILEAQRQLAESNERIAAFERQFVEQEQRQSVADQQAQVAKLQQDAVTFQAQLENQDGLTPQKAQEWAQERANYEYRIFTAERESVAKVQAAQALSQKHGVSTEALMAMNNPAAMQIEAQRLSDNKKSDARIDALEKRIADTLAPIQNFAGAGASAPPLANDAARIARMGDRENPEPITDDSIKWFKDYIAQG